MTGLTPYIETKHFRLMSTGKLQSTGEPTFADCEDYLDRLKELNIIIPFAIGDMLEYMTVHFGSYSQAVDSFDYSIGYLGLMKSVAKAFPALRRRKRIPYAYYQDIQGCTHEVQEKLLDMVEHERITSSRIMRKIVKEIKEKVKKDKEDPRTIPCLHDWITQCANCKEILIDV